MSAKSCTVRSGSDESEVLIAGSMSRFGSAETSQWDTDEPAAYGSGAYILTRPDTCVPAFFVGSWISVAFMPVRFALSNTPSDWLIRTEGIVIVGSLPPSPAGGQPATLSATMTPIAPAFWAFLTLTTNVQPPRSRSTILPATTLMSGSQAFVRTPVPAFASTTSPVTPFAPQGGPHDAVPTSSSPTAAAGVLACRGGCGPRRRAAA